VTGRPVWRPRLVVVTDELAEIITELDKMSAAQRAALLARLNEREQQPADEPRGAR
jgi:DNA-binding MarR family transcriptional regulator